MPLTKVVLRYATDVYRFFRRNLPKKLTAKSGKPRKVWIHLRVFEPHSGFVDVYSKDFRAEATTNDEFADFVSESLRPYINKDPLKFAAIVRIRRGTHWYKVAYIRTPVNVDDALIITLYTSYWR